MVQQSFLINPGTSSEDQARQRMAYEMLQQGMQGGPIGHWTQGAGRVAKALVGGWQMRKMREEGKAERSEANKLLGEVLGFGGSREPQTSSTPPWREQQSFVKPEVEAGTGATAQPGGRPQGGSVVDNIIQAESGGNPTAKNPRSSAYGSGQFIDATWLDMVRRHKPELAQGRNNDEILSLRADPVLSREITGLYAQDNGQILQRYGFEATPGNVYLAHFAGPGGAVRLLSADPSAPVANVLGRPAIEANPFLADMTVGDVQAWSAQKGGGGASPSAPAAQPQPANLDAPRSVQTQTIDPYTGNAMQGGGGQPSPQQGGMPQPPQAQQQAAPQSSSPLGIDQQTAQVIQKLSGNRHTAPLAMKLLESAMTPKSGKDRYISTGQGVFDTQTQAYVPGTEKPEAGQFEFTKYGVGNKSTGELTPYGEGNAGADPDRVKLEQGLRKEFAALSKDYRSIQEGADRVRVGANLNNAVGDLSLIFGYMKLLDPGSVVREGEFANAENAQGVPDRIRNVWNKIVAGERLNPGTRQEFVAAAEELAGAQTQRQEKIVEQFRGIATEAGLDPERIIMDFGPSQAAPPPPAGEASGTPSPQPGQPDGGQATPQVRVQSPAEAQQLIQSGRLKSGDAFLDHEGNIRYVR